MKEEGRAETHRSCLAISVSIPCLRETMYLEVEVRRDQSCLYNEGSGAQNFDYKEREERKRAITQKFML